MSALHTFWLFPRCGRDQIGLHLLIKYPNIVNIHSLNTVVSNCILASELNFNALGTSFFLGNLQASDNRRSAVVHLQASNSISHVEGLFLQYPIGSLTKLHFIIKVNVYINYSSKYILSFFIISIHFCANCSILRRYHSADLGAKYSWHPFSITSKQSKALLLCTTRPL